MNIGNYFLKLFYLILVLHCVSIWIVFQAYVLILEVNPLEVNESENVGNVELMICAYRF